MPPLFTADFVLPEPELPTDRTHSLRMTVLSWGEEPDIRVFARRFGRLRRLPAGMEGRVIEYLRADIADRYEQERAAARIERSDRA